MKRYESRGATLFGCVLFLAFAVALLILTEDTRGSAGFDSPGSALSSGPRGLSRLRRALALSGVSVDRLASGPVGAGEQTLLAVQPAVALADSEAADLERRVWMGDLTLVAAGSREELVNLPTGVLPDFVPNTQEAVETVKVVSTLPFRPAEAGILSLYQQGGEIPTEEITCFNDAPEDVSVLAETSKTGRPVVLAYNSGAGLVVLVSEPRMFENAWLHQLDNVELVASLLATQPKVTLDDRMPRVLEGADMSVSLVYGTAPGRAATLAVLAAVLIAWLRGLQPGGAPQRAVRRRRPTDFVDSMAALTLAAGPRHQLARQFQARFRRTACRALRVAPDTETAKLAVLVAERVGAPMKQVNRVLRGSPADAEVPEWIALMDSWEKRL